MTRARRAVLVACGAACGGGARWVLVGLVPIAAGAAWLAPALLLCVNASGSFLAGFIRALCGRERSRAADHAAIDAFLVAGFCGGYTSYSGFVAFSLPGDGHSVGAAVGIAAATVVLCPLAALAGMRVGGGYPAKPPRAPQDPTP
ncbi:MAG: CrcB family protein [Planctomycetota bacterium]